MVDLIVELAVECVAPKHGLQPVNVASILTAAELSGLQVIKESVDNVQRLSAENPRLQQADRLIVEAACRLHAKNVTRYFNALDMNARAHTVLATVQTVVDEINAAMRSIPLQDGEPNVIPRLDFESWAPVTAFPGFELLAHQKDARSLAAGKRIADTNRSAFFDMRRGLGSKDLLEDGEVDEDKKKTNRFETFCRMIDQSLERCDRLRTKCSLGDPIIGVHQLISGIEYDFLEWLPQPGDQPQPDCLDPTQINVTMTMQRRALQRLYSIFENCNSQL